MSTEGIWTPNGFWQILPSTFPDYQLPDLTEEEQIAAAHRYIQRKFGQVPPGHPDAAKPVPWGQHPNDCNCGDCP